MNDLTTKLAEAANAMVAACDKYLHANDYCGLEVSKRDAPQVDGAIEGLREALRLYDEATALPVQDLPPLPEPLGEFLYLGREQAWNERTGQFTADQMHAYARAALAATPAPAPTDEQIKARFESRWGEHGWRAVGAYYVIGFRDGAALAATPAQAQQAYESTCFGAGDVERLRAAAMAVFDGPECPQIARDVIEWYHSSLLVEVCDDPSPAPAQAQQAHWTPEQVLHTQEIAAELKAKIKHKPLTDEQIISEMHAEAERIAGCPLPTTAMDARAVSEVVKICRVIERACAEAWGVKLAGIGASSEGGGNG